jgi:hypothetical protein
LGGFTLAVGYRASPWVRTLILPSTRGQGPTTRSVVIRAAVIETHPGRVVTLLYINEATSMIAAPQPVPRTTQAVVTMRRVNGQWLISDLVSLRARRSARPRVPPAAIGIPTAVSRPGSASASPRPAWMDQAVRREASLSLAFGS